MARDDAYDHYRDLFYRTGQQDCDNTFSQEDVDFSSGNTAEEIVNNSLQLMDLEDWIAQNEDVENETSLSFKDAYAAWQDGWSSCAITHVKQSMPFHLTKAETLFQKALSSPGAQSIDVAQDIALENGMSLCTFATKTAEFANYQSSDHLGSSGMFEVKPDMYASWIAYRDMKNRPGTGTLVLSYSFRGQEWSSRIGMSRAAPIMSEEASREWRRRGCEYTWNAIKIFKDEDEALGDKAPTHELMRTIKERCADFNYTEPQTAEELYENPTRDVPDDPKDRFWAAVDDPDPASMDVAQDIALEHGWKLADMAEEQVRFASRLMGDVSVGEFYFEDHENLSLNRRRPGGPWINGGAWHISTGWKKESYLVEMHYQYRNERWDWRIHSGGPVNTFATLKAARSAAAAELWRALRIMKELDPTTETYIHGLKQAIAFAAENDERVIPAELRNPGGAKKQVKQEDSAVDKYREFNSFDPKDLVYVDGSPIPSKLRCLGEATQIVYESLKVIPDNGVKPRKPQGYFHDHEGDVKTYVPDPNGELDTPDFVLECDALALIGTCLGFTFKDEDGKEGKGKATKPYPDVYCTPNGRALLIIQSKKTVLAIIYGGALGVESRGIVG